MAIIFVRIVLSEKDAVDVVSQKKSECGENTVCLTKSEYLICNLEIYARETMKYF